MVSGLIQVDGKVIQRRNVSVTYRQVSFYARVTFLKNDMQIEHKNPI